VLRPKFDSEDVKKERQVVLEEIKMDLDNPRISSSRDFYERVLAATFAGAPDSGHAGNGKRIQSRRAVTRFRDWFAPDHLVVTAAGNVTHEQVLELVQREFGHMSPTGPRE